MIDISEPVEEGPAYLLYTREFYSLVQNRLTPNGLITLQAGSTALTSLTCLSAVYQTIKAVFPIVVPYQASIPSFGIPWGFVLASKLVDPRKHSMDEINKTISKRIRGELRYSDGETHTGQFLLPKHIRKAIEKENRMIEDNHPLYTYH